MAFVSNYNEELIKYIAKYVKFIEGYTMSETLDFNNKKEILMRFLANNEYLLICMPLILFFFVKVNLVLFKCFATYSN